ncbi:hypothetical protein XA68_17677 [Ophiocordyceps unilateralis]|uniref:Heterokaryon incompatibility domain-containing protein n=1 Tax=Ophiocordyceps unilateralis TaxID=268505 RepID=A0A2A9PK86_OPHUN|nr:hypothetical protein XA68_17677 [Ophiocordyceps unilateralis]
MLLLPTRRPESEPGFRRPSAATAAPELYQLPPRRPSGFGGATQEEPGCIDSDSVLYRTCARCAALDFARILDWKAGQPRAWIPLSHVLLQPQQSQQAAGSTTLCPYCLFFGAMLGPDAAAAGLGGKFTPYLRIRLAFERLGGVGERHELARCVLAEVVTRNRALPRGFIVKAQGEEEGEKGEDDDDKDARRLRGRLVPRMLDVALLKCWMHHCRETHATTCRRPSEAIVSGLRLIDCLERSIVCADGLENCEYVTLSYVWGLPDGDDDDDGFALPEVIPAVFADAMTLTTSLGLRYLWIDRFCLFPLAEEEQRRQTGLMDDILSRAELTLVAASGSKAVDGLAGVSVPRQAQLSLKTETGLYTTTLQRPDLETAASAWAGRAWTLQEGLLARRRLVLGRSQAYFQCRALHCVESVALPLTTAPTVDLGRVFPDCHARPELQIGTFMARRLARPEHRLDAFAGVLRAWARAASRPLQHLLGLPLFHPDAFVDVAVVSQTDRLAVALGWMADGTASASARTRGGGGGGASSPCRLLPVAGPGAEASYYPSWTWLAWTLEPPSDGRGFNFSLVGSDDSSSSSSSSSSSTTTTTTTTTTIIDRVCAVPGMEISIGFTTPGVVLSWEIDGGEALSRRRDPISFLRLETLCADLHLSARPPWTVDQALTPALAPHARLAIEAWVRAASPPPPDRRHRLVLVLLSGRGWRLGGAATALVCRHRRWDPAQPLLRLGALAVEHHGLVVVGGHCRPRHAVLRGEDGHLSLSMREVDLY